jgi:uracil-DNA glycosylase
MSRLDWIDPSARGNQPPSSEPGGDSLQSCRRCDLWRNATQAVGGEGPRDAVMMLVGEQPGDVEDQHGRPFVGPAGQLLDQLLQRAGIDRSGVWLTNAVKHFKWEPRGKRRIHKTPGQREVAACHVWLEQEIRRISPRVIVALGATAARALLGPSTTVDAARRAGPVTRGATTIVVTYHPSALLRSPDSGGRALLEQALADDLARAAALIGEAAGRAAGQAVGSQAPDASHRPLEPRRD